MALAAAAANLQAALPASARQVVSSDWEKVDLPVDPGVVLLDIGFTDDKHGASCTLSLQDKHAASIPGGCYAKYRYGPLHLLLRSPTLEEHQLLSLTSHTKHS